VSAAVKGMEIFLFMVASLICEGMLVVD